MCTENMEYLFIILLDMGQEIQATLNKTLFACSTKQLSLFQSRDDTLMFRYGSEAISHTSAATFHSAFTSVIGWRTDMHNV